MARARSRPPHLESRAGETRPAPPPTPEQMLDRAKVTGRSGMPGTTELRSTIERIVATDRAALGLLTGFPGVTIVDAWAAITAEFGATARDPMIDAALSLAAARRAGAKLAAVTASKRRIAFATASPASLLPFHLALVQLVRDAGGVIAEQDDSGPIRVEGRASRWLRWLDGVAVVTDGRSVLAAGDGEAARELVFVLERPAVVVADGAFAEAAWEAGVDVVAIAGLDRCALAVPAHTHDRALLIPARTDRPATAYRPLLEALRQGFETPVTPEV
jgi:hypothetical protein